MSRRSLYVPMALALTFRILRGNRPVHEIAEMTGVDVTTWRRYEKGLQMPGKKLPRIAEGLGKRTDDIRRLYVILSLAELLRPDLEEKVETTTALRGQRQHGATRALP